MKKLLAFILALVTAFSLAIFPASAAEDADVARMWLCSEKSNNSGVGHIFLFFENLSDKTLTVGKYKLAPGKDVSVGCFGTEGSDGAGVYYNLETELRHYSQLIGISVTVNEAQLDAVSKKITSFDRWDPIFNCNYAALRAWNAGPGKSIPFLIFPQLTRFFIRTGGGIQSPFNLFTRDVVVYKQSEL